MKLIEQADSLEAECRQLVTLFNAGRHVELERLARLLINHYPEHGFLWKVLGVSLHLQGKSALTAMAKAAELLPADAEAQCNLGNTLKDLGRFDEAVMHFRRALEIKPDDAGIHSILGIALDALERNVEAEATFRRVVAITPDSAPAYNNLGHVLKKLGRLEEAMVQYDRALNINPEYAVAHNNLGVVLKDLGRFDEAVASFRRAAVIRPDYAEPYINLGNVLKDLGQPDAAVAYCRRALKIKPDSAEAHNNMGNALQDLGLLDEAVVSYRRALEINHDYVDAHSNLIFAYNYHSAQPAELLLAEAKCFGQRVGQKSRTFTSWQNSPEPDRCLRIGLVSGDLRNHPVGWFLESILTTLVTDAGSRLEVIAYPSFHCNDTLSASIRALCKNWYYVVGVTDANLARKIRDDGIDILIDLSGHTAHNRLSMFAWKPAPIQVSWLGYSATTGVAQIDYLIADPHTLPASQECQFTEMVWRLPETRLCFTPPAEDIPVGRLPAVANGYITFGCFNNLAKMNDAVVALWSQIINAVPNSRLLLKAKQLNDVHVREHTLSRFFAHGIDTGRITLEGPSQRADYLMAYQRVDIALDPFPYPGGTTSVEGLWMGVPLITLAGECFLSRQGVGILMNVGLQDWIAVDTEDYAARVLRHSQDVIRLAALRAQLRQRLLASPLCDASRFSQNLALALRGMWQTWCNRTAAQ